MNAYDIKLLDTPFDPSNPSHHGWVQGQPPGIDPRHWPIDPNSGYPLMHGFTLRLPEDHRVHGPEIVGLSFFAIAPDHCDGMPLEGLLIPALLASHPDGPPEDAELAAIWAHAREEHPRLHRMKDILDCEYAVVLLTEEELLGAPCAVPAWVNSAPLADVPRPAWLDPGGSVAPSAAPRPLRCMVRAEDPNAGVKAEEFPSEESPYTSPYDPATYELLAWAKGHALNHIGGTMRPVQGVPDFSPHYIEFEESFGDYNFGGGNAQLDFLNMTFDWACG